MANMNKIECGSILDGITIASAPAKAKPSLRSRLNAASDNWEWTPKRKKIAAIAFCFFSLCGLAAGAWAMLWLQPPGLPKTAEEALAVMKSAKFERLDETQKGEYADEANKLMANMPGEERRELFKNDRESMEKLMERKMEEMAKKMARGEQIEFPFGGGPPRGDRPPGESPDRGNRPDGGGGGAEGGGGNGGGGRGGDPNVRRDNVVGRIADRVAKGNPQSNGLIGQMRQATEQARKNNGPR